jgi:outer membrane protein assembly factor BamB
MISVSAVCYCNFMNLRHRTSSRISWLSTFLLVVQFSGRLQAGDWPRFLGPHGNNISDETGLAESWSTNGPTLLWAKSVGSGYGAPSVLGDHLVLHHRLEAQEVVEAFNPVTGVTLWRYAYPSSFSDPFGYNNGPRCTPILTSQRCFCFGAEGKLLCVSLQTGKLIWQRDVAREWNVPEPFFGVGSTPLLEADKLIVMVGGQPDSAIAALDPETGKTLWESGGKKTWDGARTLGWRGEAPYRWTGEEKLVSYSSPVAATIHGRRHLLCLTRQGLLSLNPTNGEVYFSRWFQSPVNESVNGMCPVVLDDMVLVSAAYYRIGSVLLRVHPDGKSFDEVWRSPANPTERDPQTGALIPPVLEVHWNTPVLHEGHLYAFSGRNEPDATFRCVDTVSGKLLWERNERWRPHSAMQPPVYGRGSAILADGRLIVLGEGGKLGLFALNAERPEEICSAQIRQLHSPCWTAPVLSQKRLYLRSEDRLLCLDLSRNVKN